MFQEARAAIGAQHGADSTARLVLIVDQFEQTFTLGGQDAAAERRAFITAVCSAAARADGPGSQPPAAVILAVRGDFIDQMAASAELAAALQHGVFVVPPMDGRDLLEAVTGPAAAAGLQIEPALAERVAADITDAASGGTTSGLLPLLSQAMLLTWENREGDKLTLRGYELAGGITLAVQVSADNAYNALTDRQQALAPYIIRAMTVRTSDGHLTRRPAIRAELHAGRPAPDQEDIDAVLAELASRRLVVLNGATVELAHDIIITAWPRLRAWLDEEQASMLTYSTLAADAGQWQARGRSRDYLYAGARLTTVQAAASHWAEAGPPARAECAPARIHSSRLPLRAQEEPRTAGRRRSAGCDGLVGSSLGFRSVQQPASCHRCSAGCR